MIGDRIRKLREEKGWSQGQLALYSGLTQSHISQIESGKRSKVEPETVSKLAIALGATTDYLLGLTDDPRPRREAITEDEGEVALLAWLEMENPRLAELYRTVRELPEDLQDRFVNMLEEQVRLLQDLGRLREEREKEEQQEET